LALVLLQPWAHARQDDENTGEETTEASGGEGQDTDTGTTDAEPPPPTETDTPKQAEGPDVDSLRREYLKLRDKLFRARARAAAVGSALYSTRVRINLDYKSGRFYSVNRATIRLDGANVFDDTDGTIASNTAPRFEGYIAPGRHVMSIRIEASGKDDERFTSVVENTFVIQAVGGKDLFVYAKAEDDGDIAYKWKKSQKGSYKLHLNVDVKSAKPKAKSNRVRRAKN
jgi:hypothetical protein